MEFNQGNHLTAFDETLTAGYTSDGLRIWKEVNGQRTFFVYNGERVIGEMDASGNPTAVNTIGNTGLISREQGGNSSAIYYLFDPLGNVLHRLDDAGTVVSSDVYDAWGKREYSNDLTGDQYGYKGQYGYYTDQEIGLILCTHRYYDPETGRWLTKDPIGHEGGVNLYGYCANDPVNYTDTSGLRYDFHEKIYDAVESAMEKANKDVPEVDSTLSDISTCFSLLRMLPLPITESTGYLGLLPKIYEVGQKVIWYAAFLDYYNPRAKVVCHDFRADCRVSAQKAGYNPEYILWIGVSGDRDDPSIQRVKQVKQGTASIAHIYCVFILSLIYSYHAKKCSYSAS